MAGYRRFIAYVYDYESGKKGSNCGFIKVEVKDQQCSVEIHLHCPGLPENVKCNIYGFTRKDGLINGILLDTNGSRPKIVKHLAEAGLIDKVAMDIKACPDNYGNLTGIEKPDMDSIFETADFLLHGNLDYEFRTTVVRELHTQKDFEEIAGWLAGAKEYYLQAYKDSDGVLRPGYGSYTFEELQNFQKILQKTILSVGIRGID